MNAIEIKNLKKTYKGSHFSLNNVSFNIKKGTIMGFIGENGAGKTTTLGCILNTLLKDSGDVNVLGKTMYDDSLDVRNDIGVVFDSNVFPDHLTPAQLAKGMRFIYTNWNDDIYSNYLNRFSLPKTSKIKSFSKGMKMKLALSVALSHEPKLLIMDEPTSGLDPIVRDDILDVFLDFVQDENNSILLSSHITSDLEKIADYITFIHNGSIVFSEKKDTLKYEYGLLRCSYDQFKNINQHDILAFRKYDYQVDVLIRDKDVLQQKYHGVICDNISIEDIMLMLVKGEKHA